jgi:hypothetical protein
MGKENYNVAAHNLDVGPKGPVVLSLEFQQNRWNICGLVTFPSSEVNEMNFQTTHWNSRTKDSRTKDRNCMRTGACICGPRKISR